MIESMTIPARLLALAWLNVGLASREHDVPALDRTVLLEAFSERTCRLVATDSHVLLRTWVDELDAEEIDSTEPPIDVAPLDSVLLQDIEGRMAAMCKWLVKVTKKDHERPGGPLQVEVSLVDIDPDPDQPTLLPQLARQGLRFDAEVEQVVLPIVEAPFPTWRHLDQVKSEAVESLRFAQAYLGMFGSFRGLVGPVRLRFAADRPTSFSAGTYPEVHGLLMPIREHIPEPDPEVEP